MEISAGILIGGASRRMGRPKALLQADGTTLLERVCGAAGAVAEETLLIGEPPFEIPKSLLHLTVIHDGTPGLGPIGGLEALLTARPDRGCLLLACDMPNVTAKLLMRLPEGIGDAEAAVFETAAGNARRTHPCCGLYRGGILSKVRAAIAERQFGMMRLLELLRVERIALAGLEASGVENWNTPEDAAPAGGAM